MSRPTALIIGRGQYARTVTETLRGYSNLSVVTCYRDKDATTIKAGDGNWSVPSLTGQAGLDAVRIVIEGTAPDVILNAVSNFSPYGPGPSPRPFGGSFPMQIAVPYTVAQAADRADFRGLLLNACYPELVNAVVSLLGYPYHAGVGNSQTFNMSREPRETAPRFELLGHHAHLSRDSSALPLCYDWTTGEARELTENEKGHVHSVRRIDRGLRNDYSAVAAAAVIGALLTREAVFA